MRLAEHITVHRARRMWAWSGQHPVDKPFHHLPSTKPLNGRESNAFTMHTSHAYVHKPPVQGKQKKKRLKTKENHHTQPKKTNSFVLHTPTG